MKNKIKINRLHLAILIAISLISFSCKDAIQETATTRHVSKHASSNGTPDLTPNTNGIVPAVQTPANCPAGSTALPLSAGSFDGIMRHPETRLKWLQCANSISGGTAALKALTENGKTLLHFAVDGDGNLESAKFLVTTVKIDVHAKDNNGWTALMYAAQFNTHPDTVQYLVSVGADVNVQAKEGTPLLLALQRGNSEVAKYLITLVSLPAGVLVKNDHGQTALMMAAMNDNLELVNLLIAKGANNFSAVSDTKQTACDRATGKSNGQAMKTAMHDCH